MRKLTKNILKELILEEIEDLREWPDPDNPLRKMGGEAGPLSEDDEEHSGTCTDVHPDITHTEYMEQQKKQ